MAAETQYTANTGLATINVANTSLNGSSNIIYPTTSYNTWSVITGATNGTLIKRIIIKAQGTPSQGMVRLWIYNGTNSVLLREISVNPIKQVGTSGGPDISFETTIDLNYNLKSGFSLLASTQNADTFNVIAEGLNYGYFASFVRPESTNYIGNTGTASLSTASGTGTMTGTGSVLLLTATSGYNGTVVKSIRIKALAATSADGMIRLFIKSGSNYYLVKEIFVPYSNQTGTYKSFEYTYKIPQTLQLASGMSLYVSTNNSDSFVVVAEAMDWNYPSGTLSNYTVNSVSSTSETILHSYQIPSGLLFSGGLFEVYANIAATGSTNTKTFKIYINSLANGNTLTGATTLGTYTVATGVTGDNIARLFPIISDTSLECYGGTSTSTENEYATTTGTSAQATSLPSISGGFWIIITGTVPGYATDTGGLRWSMIRKIF